MKYSIQAHIKTDNNGVRNSVKELCVDPDDSRICDVEYECIDTVDEDGKVLILNMTFHLESDRDGVTSAMKGLAGVINACELGSFIKEYKSWHDEAIDGVPPQKCVQQTILRKE